MIYGISLYYPLSPLTLTKPLHILQTWTLRLVCGSQQKHKKTLSCSFIAHSTNVLHLPHLSTYFACICADSIKLRQCPPYLNKPFTGRPEKPVINIKLPSSLHYNQLESYYLVTQYNSLPLSLLRCPPYSFKHNLKKHWCLMSSMLLPLPPKYSFTLY